METIKNNEISNESKKFSVVDETEVTNFGTAKEHICHVCSKPFGVYGIANNCPYCGQKIVDPTIVANEIEHNIGIYIEDVMPPDLKGINLEFLEDNFPDYEWSFKRARAALMASEGESGDPGVERITVPFIRELATKLVNINSEEIVHVNDLFAAYAELISQVLYHERITGIYLGDQIPDERMKIAYSIFCKDLAQHLTDCETGSFDVLFDENMTTCVERLVLESSKLLLQTHNKDLNIGIIPADIGQLLCVISTKWKEWYNK